MQDRPTAVELLRAAQEFCENDLLGSLSGRVRFHARVLQNVLAILEREWEGEESAVTAEWQRLRVLLEKDDAPVTSFAALRDQVQMWNTELAARIRDGGFDDRIAEVTDVLRETVAAKLAIANPKYGGEGD